MEDMKRSKIGLIVIISIAVVVLASGLLYFKYIDSDSYKLQKKGYSKADVKEIVKLNKHIDDLLKLDYNPKIIDILKEKYYIDKNFLEYISYMNQNSDKSITDVIAIINVKANNEWYKNTLTTDASKGIEIFVNKFYKLPTDYTVEDIVPIKNWYAYEGHKIRAEVLGHYLDMFNAAKEKDLSLIINSSYRTNTEQESIYESFKESMGTEFADSYAARPGFSEHETGLALDIIKPGTNSNDFDQTDEFKWLSENSYKYGFILRYPKDKEYLTGYDYESWHYRYVGTDLAKKIYESSLTFDEYHAFYLE